MTTKLIPIEEYKEMWDEWKGCRRTTSDDYPTYHMKGITVQNHSGPGTPFKDEYDRMMFKVHNPDLPMSMTKITVDGEIYYYPDTPNNRQMIKDRGE